MSPKSVEMQPMFPAKAVKMDLDATFNDEDPPERPFTEIPKKKKRQDLEVRANLLSRLTYSYINPLLKKARRTQNLTLKDLWDLRESSTSLVVGAKFDTIWKKRMEAANKKNAARPEGSKKKPAQASVLLTLWEIIRVPVLFSMVLHIIFLGSMISGPIVLERLIEFLEDDDAPLWRGYMLASFLFLAPLVGATAFTQHNLILFRAGQLTRTALMHAVYAKCLTISLTSKESAGASVGAITTYMSNDSQRLLELAPMIHYVWSAPFMIVVVLSLLYLTIGPAAIAAVVVLISMLPLNAKLAKKLNALRVKTLKFTDRRIKITNEIIQGMKIIKFYAWEQSFIKKLLDARNTETYYIRKKVFVMAFFIVNLLAAPVIVGLVTFSVYVLLGNELSPPKVYATLAWLSALRFPLLFLPIVITQFVQARVSIQRIQFFMHQEALGDNHRSEGAVHKISIKDGEFHFPAPPKTATVTKKKSLKERLTACFRVCSKAKGDAEAHAVPAPLATAGNKDTSSVESVSDQSLDVVEAGSPVAGSLIVALANVNVDIKQGELVAVIGQVGAGKSTLLNAILGELQLATGDQSVVGSIAHVPQEAFIVNATLEENIVFGAGFDYERYNRVLSVCALKQDLDILPGGDQTEIGEKGINLSGGQKQRCSIARATYSNRDIVLFDDPLSAVDSHVARHIWDNCIKKELDGKTRVIALNQLQFLSSVDKIIVIKDGTIAYQGGYDALMNSGDELKNIIASMNAAKEDDASPSQESRTGKTGKNAKKAGVKPDVRFANTMLNLNKGAQKKGGRLTVSENKMEGAVPSTLYFRYLSVPWGPFGCALVLYMFVQEQALRVSNDAWLSIWTGGVIPGQGVAFYLPLFFVFSFVYLCGLFLRSVIFQLAALYSGKALHNRMFLAVIRSPMSFFDTTPTGRILNRFTKDVDWIDQLVPQFMVQYLNATLTTVSMLLVVAVVSPFTAAFLLPIVGVYYLLSRYARYGTIALQRLNAVSRTPIFNHFSETLNGLPSIRAYNYQDRFLKAIDRKIDNDVRSFYILQVAQQWLALRLEVLGVTIIACTAYFAILYRGLLPSSFVALSLLYALEVTQFLKHSTRMATELETKMNAVERIMEWSHLDPEAPSHTEVVPPEHWPNEGAITLNNVVLRYRKDLPTVLNLSVHFTGGERVGVVGRTGSGKSSLMLSLFRLVEPEQGSIVIDGIDIQDLGVSDLRSRLSIIPQDPVLFTGTIRDNLDPFGDYPDDLIMEVIADVHLDDEILGRGGLDCAVTEGGDNFSMGQRQLICMGRALLRNSQVLILDEATASIDMETDELIQSMIRKKFQSKTVITVAHRLHTVMDYQKILVLGEGGYILEYGAPAELLEKAGGALANMVEATGESSARRLHDIAHGRASVLAHGIEGGDEGDVGSD